MADLGMILGAALAGGAAGAGGAAKDSMKSMQDAQEKEDLVRLSSQLDEQKQMRLNEAQNNFQLTYQNNAFGHDESMQSQRQGFESGENKLQRASSEKIAANSNATSIRTAQISAGASMAAAQLAASVTRRGQDMQRGQHTLQTMQDGRVAVISYGGPGGESNTTFLKDPETGKDLIGSKDISASTLAVGKSMIDEATLTLKDQAATPEDKQHAHEQLAAARAVIQGKDVPGVPKMKATPTKDMLDKLKGDPAKFSDQMDTYTGVPGFSAAYLKGDGAAPAAPTTKTTATPGSGYPAATPATTATEPAAPTPRVAPNPAVQKVVGTAPPTAPAQQAAPAASPTFAKLPVNSVFAPKPSVPGIIDSQVPQA